MTQPIYFKLFRHRTNESIYLELLTALETINKYDEKQQFMNQLGQDDFWKKNRLDLWSALNLIKVDVNTLAAKQVKAGDFQDSILFQHTTKMLANIRFELIELTKTVFKDLRNIECENISYRTNKYIWDNQLNVRTVNSRVVHANLVNVDIRYDDISAFDCELGMLIDKYSVEGKLDTIRGRKVFDADQVADRYVSINYKLKGPKNIYNW